MTREAYQYAHAKGIRIVEAFKSKRNQVFKVEMEWKRQSVTAVMKYYSGEDGALKCREEQERLGYLEQCGIPVARLFHRDQNVLFMEYLPGILINDLVEAGDEGSWLPQMAAWLAAFHGLGREAAGPLKSDANLRNFIFFKNVVYGLDFEETGYGDPLSDIAEVCFFILTNKPAFTRAKDRMVRAFIREYAALTGRCMEGIPRQIMKSRTAARLRRVPSK